MKRDKLSKIERLFGPTCLINPAEQTGCYGIEPIPCGNPTHLPQTAITAKLPRQKTLILMAQGDSLMKKQRGNVMYCHGDSGTKCLPPASDCLCTARRNGLRAGYGRFAHQYLITMAWSEEIRQYSISGEALWAVDPH